MKPYTPRPGTVAEKILEHLKQQPPGTRLTVAEAAEVAGIDTKLVTAGLGTPLKRGVLRSERSERGGRGNAFYLPEGDDTARDQHEAADDGALHMARYSADDDLSVKGMQIDGDTAVFTREQLQQLVDFLTRPHIRPTPHQS